MARRPPRRIERPNAAGRCSCMGAHVDGLARATRKTKGNYWTEPSAPTAHHLSACPHSLLAEQTGMGRKRRRPPRALPRLTT